MLEIIHQVLTFCSPGDVMKDVGVFTLCILILNWLKQVYVNHFCTQNKIISDYGSTQNVRCDLQKGSSGMSIGVETKAKDYPRAAFQVIFGILEIIA